MKPVIYLSILLSIIAGTRASAQENTAGEKYGNTLNLGFGVGYYGYIGHTLPVIHADYEIDVARNFTLAPFITMYTFRNYAYWGNPNYPYRNYYYRQTVIPVGLKGTYYFDKFLHANAKWDFYLAGSVGFAFRSTRWENGYYGTTVLERGASGIYLDGHIGTEYHFNSKVGMYLDLSTGISTLGLAFHL
jgi:hypothetical protein